ncbi:MAG: SCO family protein [bacterium]|nr:SCO family protein [bacterium]
MTSPTAPGPADSSPARRSTGLARALWVLSIAVVVAALIAGFLSRKWRAEPLPVIKQVPEFALTHHDGSTVTREDFLGGPWIADFIFTRCPAICPRMTAQMKRVTEALGEGSQVKIASFSVDPEHDTPEVLAAYAADHGAGEGWYFLTGEAATIHTLCREGFLLAVDASPPADVSTGSDPIIHSNRFVLIDAENQIRGYYDPFDEDELARLVADVKGLLR